MEFTCPKDILQKAMHIAERGVSSRSTMPILINVLLQIKDSKLVICGTNMDLGITIDLEVNNPQEGAVLIESKTLSNIVSKLPNREVQIKTNDSQGVDIICGSSHFTIHGLPADEFPEIPKIKDAKKFSIEKKDLIETIKQTIISVSIDENKHVLNGVFLTIKPEELIGVATDGYRLSAKVIKKPFMVEESAGFIVPPKALQELMAVIAEGKGQKVTVFYDSDNALFSYDNIQVFTRLIKGIYPEYSQVVPSEYAIIFKVNRAEFMKSLERCSIIAASGTNTVKLDIVDHQLLMEAHTPDVGHVSELIDIEKEKGDKIQISLNVRLLLDGLKNMDTEMVNINMIDILKPAMVAPVGDANTNDKFSYVVMPIRVKEKVTS